MFSGFGIVCMLQPFSIIVIKNKKIKKKYKIKAEDKTKQTYNRRQKKYKTQHEKIEIRQNIETKRKYTIHTKFLDDGNAKKIPSANRIQNISLKDKNHGVQKKWKLQDGTIKKRYKHVDIYETTTIYERQKRMGWQVNIKIWTKKYKSKTVFIKHMSEPIQYTEITYKKVKSALARLMNYAEFSALKSDFHIVKMKPYLRYYDDTGGTVKQM